MKAKAAVIVCIFLGISFLPYNPRYLGNQNINLTCENLLGNKALKSTWETFHEYIDLYIYTHIYIQPFCVFVYMCVCIYICIFVWH